MGIKEAQISMRKCLLLGFKLNDKSQDVKFAYS